MSVRIERVASVIKRCLAGPVTDIAREISAGMVTLTSVRVSADLQNAKVYISVFGGKVPPAALISALDRKKGELRHIVGREVRLRLTPDLKFFIDDTLDQMERIQKLLDSVPPSSASESEEPEE